MDDTLRAHLRCANSAVQRLTGWDIGLITVCSLLGGVFLAKSLPVLVTMPAWTYVVGLLGLSAPLVVRAVPLYTAAYIRDRRSREP